MHCAVLISFSGSCHAELLCDVSPLQHAAEMNKMLFTTRLTKGHCSENMMQTGCATSSRPQLSRLLERDGLAKTHLLPVLRASPAQSSARGWGSTELCLWRKVKSLQWVQLNLARRMGAGELVPNGCHAGASKNLLGKRDVKLCHHLTTSSIFAVLERAQLPECNLWDTSTTTHVCYLKPNIKK